MTLSAWIIFATIGIIDLLVQFKSLCKKEKKLYLIFFVIYQMLFALTWMGLIPQHLGSIIKFW